MPTDDAAFPLVPSVATEADGDGGEGVAAVAGGRGGLHGGARGHLVRGGSGEVRSPAQSVRMPRASSMPAPRVSAASREGWEEGGRDRH